MTTLRTVEGGMDRGRRAESSRPASVRVRPGPAGWVLSLRQIPTSTVLVGLVIVLCVVGLVMVGSASEVVSIETYGSPWSILLRELLWLAVGTVVFVVAARTDYHHWRRFSRVALIGTFVTLLAVLVPGIGTHVGGSTRWLGVGPLQLQPSELMKLALALAGADLVVRRQGSRGGDRAIVGPLLLITVASAGLVLLQPDMGTAIVLCCIALALLFAGGVQPRMIGKIVGVGVAGAVVVGIADPYRRARLLSFIDPGAHASGSGYQVLQSLIGLGSGHLLGVGLGNGQEKWGFLPNAHTDFIFSVIGEELGLLGTLSVLVLLTAFAWFGLRTASRAPDPFGSLLAVGLIAWIGAETVINIGAVIGVMPVTGIPLPFISYGGSSLVLTMLAAGMLVNIAGHERAGPGSGSRIQALPELGRDPR